MSVKVDTDVTIAPGFLGRLPGFSRVYVLRKGINNSVEDQLREKIMKEIEMFIR